MIVIREATNQDVLQLIPLLEQLGYSEIKETQVKEQLKAVQNQRQR